MAMRLRQPSRAVPSRAVPLLSQAQPRPAFLLKTPSCLCSCCVPCPPLPVLHLDCFVPQGGCSVLGEGSWGGGTRLRFCSCGTAALRARFLRASRLPKHVVCQLHWCLYVHGVEVWGCRCEHMQDCAQGVCAPVCASTCAGSLLGNVRVRGLGVAGMYVEPCPAGPRQVHHPWGGPTQGCPLPSPCPVCLTPV